MKILGQLLVWISLAVGAASAATAYLVDLGSPDEQLVGLTAAPPPTSKRATDEQVDSIVEKNQPLTPELLARLRDAGLRDLRVKEFHFQRWRGKWWFGLSLLGLLAGALLTRLGAKTERSIVATTETTTVPAEIMVALQREIDELRSQLRSLPDREAQLNAIVEGIGELQKTHMVAWVDARDTLVRQSGLAGYAVLMDTYAAAERQLNRAWSAAVDGAYDEAITCLDEGAVLADKTRQALGA